MQQTEETIVSSGRGEVLLCETFHTFHLTSYSFAIHRKQKKTATKPHLLAWTNFPWSGSCVAGIEWRIFAPYVKKCIRMGKFHKLNIQIELERRSKDGERRRNICADICSATFWSLINSEEFWSLFMCKRCKKCRQLANLSVSCKWNWVIDEK